MKKEYVSFIKLLLTLSSISCLMVFSINAAERPSKNRWGSMQAPPEYREQREAEARESEKIKYKQKLKEAVCSGDTKTLNEHIVTIQQRNLGINLRTLTYPEHEQTLLHYAVNFKKPFMVKYLLEMGLGIDALCTGDERLCKGEVLHLRMMSPLGLAMRSGQRGIMLLLLSWGAKTEALNGYKKTLLSAFLKYLCANLSRREFFEFSDDRVSTLTTILEALVRYGTDLTALDDEGYSALHELVFLAVEGIRLKDPYTESVIESIFTIFTSYKKILKELFPDNIVKHIILPYCGSNFNINIQDIEGLTPLMRLIKKSMQQLELTIDISRPEMKENMLKSIPCIMEVFVKAEADIDQIRDKNGKTVIDYIKASYLSEKKDVIESLYRVQSEIRSLPEAPYSHNQDANETLR